MSPDLAALIGAVLLAAVGGEAFLRLAATLSVWGIRLGDVGVRLIADREDEK